MKCGWCGLELEGHTDEKCIMVIRRERDAAVTALKDMSRLLGKAAKTGRTVVKWIKDHKSHEAINSQDRQPTKR